MLIQNQGQAIISTDYWDSEHAVKGFFFLSWNAAAARLLVPDCQESALREMRGAREVIISRGPCSFQGGREALELMWEDDSDSPYCILVTAEQTDRLTPDTDQEGGFIATAWTREGLQGRWPGRYRVVDSLPCLLAWRDH